MSKIEKSSLIVWGMGLALLVLAVASCRVPETESELTATTPGKAPTKTITPQQEVEGAGVPETAQINFDIIAEKDYDKPWLVHFTVYPLVDPALIAENPGSRLFLEIHPPRGTTLVDGMHRMRFSLDNIDKQMMESDIRVDVFGDLEVKVTGFLADQSGKKILRGDAYYMIVSKDGGEVELKGQSDKTAEKKGP